MSIKSRATSPSTSLRSTIVLATGPDALLRVDGALELGQLCVGVRDTEEERLVLIHAL